MPELEIMSTRQLELDLAVASTLTYPKLSDFHKRQACRADLARVHSGLLTDMARHGRYGFYLDDEAAPPRDDLLEDRLAGCLRVAGRRYALVAEVARFLVVAALGAPEQLSLRSACFAASRTMTRPGKRGTTPRTVRREWEELGPAGALALALSIVQTGSPNGRFSLRHVADIGTCVADVIEGAHNRHLKKRPVVASGFFWRLPRVFQRQVEMTVGDARGVAEAMIAGDPERLRRTLEGLPPEGLPPPKL
jgi:hypothetical protein